MFGHRKCFGRFRTYTKVPGGYRNPPGSILGLMGLSGRRGRAARAAARPSPSSLNWTRRGAPFSFSPSLPSFSSPTPTWKGGVLLPVGVGLLMGRAIGGRPPPPPPLLYIRGGGHPLETLQLIIDLLAMCGAPFYHNPPRSYRSGA